MFCVDTWAIANTFKRLKGVIMAKIVRTLTHSGYKNIIKPVLFKQRPDSVHKHMVKMAKLVGHVPGVRSLPKLWSYQNTTFLEQNVAGLLVRNPVGLSAGLDKGIETPRIMRAVGFGFMTGGSVTWGQYKGNEGDWFYRLPKSQSLVVHAGLPSEGTEVVLGRVAKYPENVFNKFPLVVSVAKTNSERTANDIDGIRDYAASLAMFDSEKNVSAMEINISCPNAFGGEDFTTPERLDTLLSTVDAMTLDKPIFIKMPISVPKKQFLALTDIAAAHHVTGLTIGNLRKDRGNVALKDDLPATVKGNLSGAPNRELTTELVRATYQRHGKQLVLIGVGGVFTAQHAYEKIRAGATLVEMITGVIFEGPQVVGEINAGLVELLKRDGFTNISQAIGVDASND